MIQECSMPRVGTRGSSSTKRMDETLRTSGPDVKHVNTEIICVDDRDSTRRMYETKWWRIPQGCYTMKEMAVMLLGVFCSMTVSWFKWEKWKGCELYEEEEGFLPVLTPHF